MAIYHKEHLLDHGVMAQMRTMLAVQPKLQFVPEARPNFDDLMEKTPEAAGVTYEAADIGGVAGWWCKPQQSVPDAAIVYFHGGAYVLGSATAYRNFIGQIAARAETPIFVVDYRLAPEHLFRQPLTTRRPRILASQPWDFPGWLSRETPPAADWLLRSFYSRQRMHMTTPF